jgi:hypothetical protein
MNTSIVSALEKLTLFADYHADMTMLSAEVHQLSGQIQTIIVAVDSALRNLGDEKLVRADLEEIRAAAVRAIMKMHALEITTSSAAVAAV